MSLLVGKPAPDFKDLAVVGGPSADLTPDNAFTTISLSDYKGKWLVFFFYPLDFTFVCPTELAEFGKKYEEFKKLNCEVLSCSTDSHFSHYGWRVNEPKLNSLPYPMLADFTRKVASSYEILKEETGYALRGLYIIDPDGVLRYAVVHPESVGRNTTEVLRVLQSLQTGEKTACDWTPGDKTLG